VRMTLVPAFLTLLRERSWYIPGWLDRLLPDVTVEAPHDGEAKRTIDVERPAEAVGRP
jgi:putative drug exporter of the RND superfamily